LADELALLSSQLKTSFKLIPKDANTFHLIQSQLKSKLILLQNEMQQFLGRNMSGGTLFNSLYSLIKYSSDLELIVSTMSIIFFLDQANAIP